MLDIGFIFPSSEYLFDPFKGDPHTHFQILTVLDSHFGEKINTSVIDLRGIKREFAKYHIPEKDVYMHSIYTLDFNEQKSLVETLRERYPKAKHVAGGPHANFFREETSQIFDSIVLGDGEESVKEIINDINNSELKKIYEQKGPIDINSYPYPLRKYLPEATVARKGLLNLRNKSGFGELLSATVVFSRGCSYNCSFCAMPRIKSYNPGIRFRKPELIAEEIEYLKKEYGMQGISLLDEIAFPKNFQKAKSHLEAIAKTGIIWRGQCRVDGVTSDIAKLLKDSNCVTMCMGVESAAQECLDRINKKTSVERSKESIKFLKQEGIETRLYMILGLPGEPKDIVEKTWQYIKETDPEAVYLSLLTIRPGTEMFDNPDKFGIAKVKTDWDRTMHMYSRYGKERPNLTFEYKEMAPWGRGFSEEEIINNYLELQGRILENNKGPL